MPPFFSAHLKNYTANPKSSLLVISCWPIFAYRKYCRSHTQRLVNFPRSSTAFIHQSSADSVCDAIFTVKIPPQRPIIPAFFGESSRVFGEACFLSLYTINIPTVDLREAHIIIYFSLYNEFNNLVTLNIYGNNTLFCSFLCY